VLKFFKLAAAAVALVCWFSSFLVWNFYAGHRTSTNEPDAGRIHPLNTHGSVVYLTSGEHYLLYGVIAGGVVFFLLTVAMHFSADRS
jgi:hypothetical protein